LLPMTRLSSTRGLPGRPRRRCDAITAQVASESQNSRAIAHLPIGRTQSEGQDTNRRNGRSSTMVPAQTLGVGNPMTSRESAPAAASGCRPPGVSLRDWRARCWRSAVCDSG
jgi:hypothetical protein